MSSAVIAIGDKLHIMTRRIFENDIRRHFIGEVTSADVGIVEIRGYTFIFHPGANEYRRLPEERTRIFSVGEAGHVVNKIPKDVVVSAVTYKTVDNRLLIADGRSFSLPINEFGSSR